MGLGVLMFGGSDFGGERGGDGEGVRRIVSRLSYLLSDTD